MTQLNATSNMIRRDLPPRSGGSRCGKQILLAPLKNLCVLILIYACLHEGLTDIIQIQAIPARLRKALRLVCYHVPCFVSI